MADPRFESVPAVREALQKVDYLSDEGIAGIVYLADRLGKPVLVEGPAGTGKTQLAKSVAEMTGARLIRLQCYEGLDESKALYEWNYKKQLLRIQAERNAEDTDLGRHRGRHLLRRVPAHPPAARGHPRRRPGGAADRRGRPGRGRDRGAAARDPLRLPGLDPRAGHHRGQADPAGVPHLQQHPRALRGAQAPLPVPAHRLPRPGAREGDRAHQGARHHRAPGRPGGPHRALDPPARAEEGAVGVRDARLGPHPAAARRRAGRRRHGHEHHQHPAQVPDATSPRRSRSSTERPVRHASRPPRPDRT